MNLGRVLGVDLGSRRVGLALSDPQRVIASPLCVIERRRARDDDHAAILAIAEEHDVNQIVVGLPRTLAGEEGPAAAAVLDEVDALRRAARSRQIAVETYDERLTTVVAQRALADAGVSSKAQRVVVDKVAAAVMLEGWLVAQA